MSPIYPSPFLLLLAQTINMMVRGPVDTDIMAAWMDTASQTSMLFTKAGGFIHQNIFGRTCVLGEEASTKVALLKRKAIFSTNVSHKSNFNSEKAMATHSSTLSWKIPWMEEPGRLQSMGSLRIRHDWVTSLSRIGEGNGNPLQYSCLENPREREPVGLPSMGSYRVGHDWCDLAAAAAAALGFPGGRAVKNLPANAGDTRDRFDTWVGKIPWKRKWQPTPVFLPG